MAQGSCFVPESCRSGGSGFVVNLHVCVDGCLKKIDVVYKGQLGVSVVSKSDFWLLWEISPIEPKKRQNVQHIKKRNVHLPSWRHHRSVVYVIASRTKDYCSALLFCSMFGQPR